MGGLRCGGAGAFAILGVLGAVGCSSGNAPVKQPIAFNHAIHMTKDTECISCHSNVETSPYATLPSNDVCMGCHDQPSGKSPEEPKVRELNAKGPIPWIQVNREPGHVYFSHQAHVTWGKLKCEECHGDMAKQTEPVTTSQVQNLTMSVCMDCHRKMHARNDCLICHK
jgi:menaquinone reductase, multiheme cytochrome c subunit